MPFSDTSSEIEIDPRIALFNIFHASVDIDPQFSPAMFVFISLCTDIRCPALSDSNKQFAECGSTPIKNADELQSIGYSIVIFPGGLIRAFTHMALEYFDSLKKHGSNEPFYSRMLDFKELNELLGTDEIIDIGKKYDPSSLNK